MELGCRLEMAWGETCFASVAHTCLEESAEEDRGMCFDREMVHNLEVADMEPEWVEDDCG